MPIPTLKTDPLGFLSVDPAPSTLELEQFYRAQYYQNESGQYRAMYSEEELVYFSNYARALLTVLAEHRSNGEGRASLLDAGCGEGFQMKEAMELGFDVTGVDFSSFGLESQNPELLPHFIQGDLLNLSEHVQGRTFDCVIAKGVLEHVIDPRQTLQALKKVLKPSGLLAVMVPNDYSSLHRYLIDKRAVEKEYWFVPPQHLHYFQFDSLARLLESQGFCVLDRLGDIPVDLFLLDSRTNYYEGAREFGKTVHSLRCKITNFLCEPDLSKYIQFQRDLAKIGLGRSIAMYAKAR